MTKGNLSTVSFLQALSNEKRYMIVQWLLDPTEHFAPQVDGDLVKDGVCLGGIVRKLGISQPATTAQMQILINVNLVSSKKIKNWVFFKADEKAIETAIEELSRNMSKI